MADDPSKPPEPPAPKSKVRLTVAHVAGISNQEICELFKQITGRDPTPEEIKELEDADKINSQEVQQWWAEDAERLNALGESLRPFAIPMPGMPPLNDLGVPATEEAELSRSKDNQDILPEKK